MPQEIGVGARIFVFLVYLGLGLSFLATTAILAHEFSEIWLARLRYDGQPLVSLFPDARRRRAACLLHSLMRSHRPLLAPRAAWKAENFAAGILLLGGASYLIAAELLASPKRSAWEIAPAVLKEDKGEPPGCALVANGTCRLPILQALKNLRQVSQTHLGLGEFIRDCDRDVLVEGTSGPEGKRFCFASTPLSPSPPLQLDADCCPRAGEARRCCKCTIRASEAALAHGQVARMAAAAQGVLPIAAAGDQRAPRLRHESISSITRVAWRGSNSASSSGRQRPCSSPSCPRPSSNQRKPCMAPADAAPSALITPLLSLAFGAWTLLMVFFFYRRRDKEIEALGKMGSAAAEVLAVLQYTILTAVFVRALGSGADAYSLIALLTVCTIAAIVTLWAPWDLIQSRWK